MGTRLAALISHSLLRQGDASVEARTYDSGRNGL